MQKTISTNRKSFTLSFLVRPIALALVIAFAALGGFAGLASAEEPVTETKYYIVVQGESSWCEQGGEGEKCFVANLDGGTGKMGDLFVCLTVSGSGPKGETYEEGCADASGTLNVDPADLSSASLASMPVDLYTNVCDPDSKECRDEFSRTVSLAAVWTGEGRTEKISSHGVDHQHCQIQYHNTILFQHAAINISLDGAGHEGDGILQFNEETRRYVCPPK